MIPHSRPHVSAGEIAAVARALEAGHISQGEEVARLESDLSAMFGGAEAVAVSSGTAALCLALAALGLRKGGKVIIPSYTCRSLYAAVAHAGGNALCADTGPSGVCITPETVTPLLKRGARAVIVPHMFGFTADAKGIAGLGLPVIEDCAQAAGGLYPGGDLLGTAGDISVLSFYATKLLPAGEGGACITRRKKLADTIRRLRNCDESPLDPRAFNFKMGDLNAALARAVLKALKQANAKRLEMAQLYDKAFGAHTFRIRAEAPQAVCFRYLLDLSPASRDASCKGNMQHEADKLVKTFIVMALKAGITCRRPVWEPLHYALGGRCPQSERRHNTLVSIPAYPGLSAAELGRICRTIQGILD